MKTGYMLLISYRTVVGVYTVNGWEITDKNYSSTTSKQLTQFKNQYTTSTIKQEYLEKLAGWLEKQLTIESAKLLQHGDRLVTTSGDNWRVSGKVKLWKCSPGRFKVPIKYGLYNNSYITEENYHRFSIA